MEERRSRALQLALVAVALVIGVVIVSTFSVGSVSVGEVAVLIDPLTGTKDTAGDGKTARWFLKAPWVNVIRIYTAVDAVHMWTEAGKTGDFPAVPCLTQDGLSVEVDITVRWSILPSEALTLFEAYPMLDWKAKAIIPVIRRGLRDTMTGFTAVECIEKREAVGTAFAALLEEELAKEKSLQQAISLGTVDLRDISLPATFTAAIEAKLASEQLAIAAEFNKTRVLVMANATAWKHIIEAEGLAQSRIIVANGTAESLRIIAEETQMTGAELGRLYLTLEALKDIAEEGKATFFVVTTGEGMTWLVPLGEKP